MRFFLPPPIECDNDKDFFAQFKIKVLNGIRFVNTGNSHLQMKLKCCDT